MAFHHVRFPINISLNSRGGPMRKTDIVTLASGAEQRNQRWANSRRTYNAAYGVKSRQDMVQILEFFEERRGRLHGFLWRDGLDYTSSGTKQISADDQQIGIGDGTTKQFQLIKTYGGDFDPYERKITKPIAQSVKIKVGANELNNSDFFVDEQTGIITLNSAPANGEIVKAGFEFDVPVRFDIDHLDVELSNFDAANIANIPLVEVLL